MFVSVMIAVAYSVLCAYLASSVVDAQISAPVFRTVHFNQTVVEYNFNSENSFSLPDYTFKTVLYAGHDLHKADGWKRQVRFARCKSSEDLYNTVADNCDVADIGFVDFNASNYSSLVSTLDWIQNLRTTHACFDVSWDDGHGTSSAKLSWYVSYNAVKDSGVLSNQVFDSMCIEQKYSVEFSTQIDASASFIGSPNLTNTIEDVRVIEADMKPCTEDKNGMYRLAYTILLSLTSNPSDGMTGYIPYAVRPQDTLCHFNSSSSIYQSSIVEQKSDLDFVFHMSTACRLIDQDCNSFQNCAPDNHEYGVNKYGIDVMFKRGADASAINGTIDASIKYTECANEDSYSHNITGYIDVWRTSNVAGYELVNTEIETVSVGETLFVVAHARTDIFDATENTTLLEPFLGYEPSNVSLCSSSCSLEGCKSDGTTSPFDQIALQYYDTQDGVEYTWKAVVPDGKSRYITVSISSHLTKDCLSSDMMQTALIQGAVTLNVTQTALVIYDLPYIDVFPPRESVDERDMEWCCHMAFQQMGLNIICDVSESATSHLQFILTGMPSSIDTALDNILSQHSVLTYCDKRFNSIILVFPSRQPNIQNGSAPNRLWIIVLVSCCVTGLLLCLFLFVIPRCAQSDNKRRHFVHVRGVYMY